jgi:hypothetical protein
MRFTNAAKQYERNKRPNNFVRSSRRPGSFQKVSTTHSHIRSFRKSPVGIMVHDYKIGSYLSSRNQRWFANDDNASAQNRSTRHLLLLSSACSPALLKTYSGRKNNCRKPKRRQRIRRSDAVSVVSAGICAPDMRQAQRKVALGAGLRSSETRT